MITKKVDIDLVLPCISLFIFLSFINPLISVVYASPGDDSNDKEIGVEWVNYYYGSAPDLEYTDEDANGFLDYLISKGFYEKFRFGNSFAWERILKSLV